MVKQLVTVVVGQYPYHQMEVKLLLGLLVMMEMELMLVMYAFLDLQLLVPQLYFALNHLTSPLR